MSTCTQSISSTNRRARRDAPRGFTLLEVAMALVLVALLMAIAAPGLAALSGAELKKSAGMIGGLVRDTYARTALSGHSSRLVIDLEKSAYWIEDSNQPVRLRAQKQSADKDGHVVLDVVDEELQHLADSTDEKDKTKLQLLSGPVFKPVEGDEGTPSPLPSDVRFKSIWVEHLEEPAKAGQAAIYFYPGGNVEEAHITLTDDDNGERTATVVIAPLTGEISIVNEEPPIPTPVEE